MTEDVPLGGKVLSVTKVLLTVTVPFFNINMYIIDDIGIECADDEVIIKFEKNCIMFKKNIYDTLLTVQNHAQDELLPFGQLKRWL